MFVGISLGTRISNQGCLGWELEFVHYLRWSCFSKPLVLGIPNSFGFLRWEMAFVHPQPFFGPMSCVPWEMAVTRKRGTPQLGFHGFTMSHSFGKCPKRGDHFRVRKEMRVLGPPTWIICCFRAPAKKATDSDLLLVTLGQEEQPSHGYPGGSMGILFQQNLELKDMQPNQFPKQIQDQ